ncbi:MAG: Flagellar protein FlgJ [Devosia sp.]|nr:Flagellar protein FlgJ [Devosia sp.]
MLLDFIRKIETGKADASAYDVIYAHAQARLPKPITSMTVAELQHHQTNGWPANSTAAGAYQFMRATLKDLRKELGLLDGQVFDANLQDRLGYHLLKRRGYEQFMAGKIGVAEFGKRLAQEWASLPLLAPANGNTRGESYYDGDGLNKALTTPDTLDALLAKVKAAGNGPISAPPAPDYEHFPEPSRTAPVSGKKAAKPKDDAGWLGPAIIILIALAVAGAFFWR